MPMNPAPTISAVAPRRAGPGPMIASAAVERLEVVDARQLGAVDGRMEAGAGGDQQGVVGEPAPSARTTRAAVGSMASDARRLR